MHESYGAIGVEIVLSNGLLMMSSTESHPSPSKDLGDGVEVGTEMCKCFHGYPLSFCRNES